jgi:small-conductance mechanosensitive channel
VVLKIVSESTSLTPQKAFDLPSSARIQDLGDWFAALTATKTLVELSVLGLCAGLAFGMIWLLRRRMHNHNDESIFFGRRLFDGVLFPFLFLCLTYFARIFLAKTISVQLLHLAIPVLASLVVIRVVVKVLRAAFKQSSLMRFIERTFSWLVWLALVLWVSGLLPLMMTELENIKWKVGGSTLSLRDIFEGIFASSVVLLIALWISSSIETRLLRSATGGSELSLRKALSNALRGVLLFVGLIASFSLVGIDLTALSVLGGAVGVGIGLGLQKLAANYISGFVILTERSICIGDYVRVDNFEGRITDIKTRYTVIRSLNGRESIVPNEMLVVNRVENMALSDTMIEQSTVLTVALDSDVGLVGRILVAAALEQPRVIPVPEPFSALSAFGPHGLEFTLNYWIKDPENGLKNVRSYINLSILKAMREAKIVIVITP